MEQEESLVSIGIPGLDDVLHGGLSAERLYVVEGDPGSGKTTLALQFLLAGAALGERTMLVTLSENEREICASAASHGWSLDPIEILEVAPDESGLAEPSYPMFHASEVELAQTTKSILTETERVRPVRLVIDSLSELRLLAQNSLRYRRQILALKQYFARRHCTVLIIDDRTGSDRDMHLHSLAHGVVSLERETPMYGALRRKIRIDKMRGRAFREGHHDYVIRRGGLAVFPRLVAGEHYAAIPNEMVSSGVPALDSLLCGGITRGTSMLIVGAAGTGKSSIASQYALSMGERGQRACAFLFDESIATYLLRSAGLGIELGPLLDSKQFMLRQVDPAELSPGEFTHAVRRAVEEDGARLIVIDSLNGYLNAMPSERHLLLHLHELLSYLGHRGVTTLLVMTQPGIAANGSETPIDASYIADSVLLLRYFELFGQVKQAISVIKKRTGDHDRTIRELRLGPGIVIGEPLRDLQGVLSGLPEVAHTSSDAKHGTSRPD